MKEKQLFAVILTNKEGDSMLMASLGAGVAVYPSANAAQHAAVAKFGEQNPHVTCQIARIGVVVQK